MKKILIKDGLNLEIINEKVRIGCFDSEMGFSSDLNYDEVNKLITELKKARTLIKKEQKDIEFLKEIKEHLVKANTDVTEMEFVKNMIDDWLYDLTNEQQ